MIGHSGRGRMARVITGILVLSVFAGPSAAAGTMPVEGPGSVLADRSADEVVGPHGDLTGWRRFGVASATGRGQYGNPRVELQSTTLRDPGRVRVVVTGSQARLDYVEWSITCFNTGGFNPDTRSGSAADVRLPFKQGYSMTGWDYCEMTVLAEQSWTGGRAEGSIKVKLQARYR